MGQRISIPVEVIRKGVFARGYRAAGVLLLIALTACGSDTSFESPESAARIRAIQRAANEKDTTSVPQLISLLESDDPAVRMLSVRTLESLTGEKFDFDFAAPEYERAAGVRRWQEWYSGTRGGASPSASRTVGRSEPGDSSEHP